ncbi:hypothetical protein M0802_000905 [Mischocyttarus mexicanus]|nr:hypothetical protein M0802_000905 [Mischocyttarus mexicanus]
MGQKIENINVGQRLAEVNGTTSLLKLHLPACAVVPRILTKLDRIVVVVAVLIVVVAVLMVVVAVVVVYSFTW